jgi:non-specific serine/threonine protein kinase
MGVPGDRRAVIPSTLSRFWGRQPELKQLRSLLDTERLVTIIGVGGVGKTRLALELARSCSGSFPGGVWLVDLARLESPELVGRTIAQSVGAPEDRSLDYLERAARVLWAGRQLLLLDNCEHVLAAAAGATLQLLAACPDLRVLATSREPFGVEGEQAWRAPPLDTPAAGVLELSVVAETAAVQLFCDRARHAIPMFNLTTANVAEVATICRGLDGLPLALELAAAWVPVLSLKQVSSRLGDSLALLVSGGSARLPRHRTIRATLDWSHQLLTPVQQAAFARLSVFVGGFTVEAAEAAFTGLALEGTPLELIASLVARSLVVADVSTEEARYRLLEPVRQYAAAKLRAAPEQDNEARTRHLRFLADLAEAAEWPIFGGPDLPWLRRLDDELPNIRAALRWGFGSGRDDAARLASALIWFLYVRDLDDEGIDWARSAIQAGRRQRGKAALMAGVLSIRIGEFEAAERYLTESRQLAIEDGRRRDLVNVLAFQAGLALHRGDIETARTAGEEALNLARQAGDERLLIKPLNRLALVAVYDKDLGRARDLYRQAIAVAERHEAVWPALAQRTNLAEIAIEMEDYGSARHALSGLFPIMAETGATPSIAVNAVSSTGILAVQRGEPAVGLRLLGAARAQMDLHRYRDLPLDAERYRRWIETATEQAAGEADAAWSQGLELSLDQALAEAQAFLAETPEAQGDTAPTRPSIAELGAEPGAANSFLRDGEFWALGFAGRVVRLRDSKGLRDIARLLACPGRELAAVDLAASVQPGILAARYGTQAESGLGLQADAGPLLDAQARHEYRERLKEVEGELAEAAADNDPERAAQAHRERDLLLSQLGAAVGLGGRQRASLDPAERARKAVTGRIREAIGHIEVVHSELGHHLRRSIRTGTFCAYDPPAPTVWVL